MLEDIVTNLQNHVETGQIPKPYRYFFFSNISVDNQYRLFFMYVKSLI